MGRKIAILTALVVSFIVVTAVVGTVVVNAMSAVSPAAAPAEVVEGSAGQAPNGEVSAGLDKPVPACDFASLVGKNAKKIDRSVFGDRPVRLLRPGMAVTMEYLEGRINLLVDDKNIITQVTCG